MFMISFDLITFFVVLHKFCSNIDSLLFQFINNDNKMHISNLLNYVILTTQKKTRYWNWVRFLIFWVCFRFSEKVLNSLFVVWFPLFLGPFLHFLCPFQAFRKSFKFLVCWSFSSFFSGSENLKRPMNHY